MVSMDRPLGVVSFGEQEARAPGEKKVFNEHHHTRNEGFQYPVRVIR